MWTSSMSRYDQSHSFGALATERVIATVWARPTSAKKRVASPMSRNAPSAASMNNTVHPKTAKLGSTRCSTTHEYGGNTGYSTAQRVNW
jgi:hypothetical protein